MNRILIKNAVILDPESGRNEPGDILIADGVFSAVGGQICCEDAQVIDAAGLTAAPGLVDMHVHLRDPGFTEKEDILTGCRAAAAGGVTSLLCMPNTNPPVDTPETVRYIWEKAEKADARVYVAAAITKGLKSEEINDLRALREAGAIALSDDGRPVVDSRLMGQAMRLAPSLHLKVASHCEDLFLSAGGKMNEGAVSEKLGVPGVPAAAEDCGTAREIALAAAYGVPVHICHVSTAASVALIRDAKRRGVPVTAETAPHYFALTEEELLRRDADYRMSPPLRTEKDRLAVIEGLRDGTIDTIATDHAPHTPQEKEDFLAAPNGSIGMETSLAAGITYLVHIGIITMAELISLMSTAPAKLLGLNAGTLQEMAPADLVLFDPEERWTVDVSRLHGKSRNAVFKGRELIGRVKMTVCRGKIVYRE
ncbi:dihydroorotase [Caproiciproducens galactitolivorans]|uniref:Dihydroorotase n=1 Tax=Caproiciproducens galactitolivorans TaxID=642589 RepID=A0A4Z0YF40_9FIRM|nr:dihydroorotase [Caproiciproducens galactitolivorans]QEY35664.1 dihydroorotase [Caproiciproducens galactitolivorans]TGJ77393.1 dihydroorotase [Caproiciproducens galactitolivorans]